MLDERGCERGADTGVKLNVLKLSRRLGVGPRPWLYETCISFRTS
jgi:hypothetical protein